MDSRLFFAVPEDMKETLTAAAGARSPRLYYEAEGSRPQGALRVLLISYHFPPDPAVGGLRWQQMTRHFAEYGWVTDVVCREFESVKGLDLTRLQTLAPGTRLFSVPGREPLLGRLHTAVWPRMRRLLKGGRRDPAIAAFHPSEMRRSPKPSFVRAYLTWLLLAREGKWAAAAARTALDLARTEQYLAVISSGPPHMAHVAGRKVARNANLPLIVDMRDPWSLVERLHPDIASKVWTLLTSQLERRVLADAAIVTMNTEVSRKAMREHYPALASRFEVVRNGSDPNRLIVSQFDNVFRIRYAGSIYLNRDPRLVFRAAAQVIQALSLSPRQFIIEFIGHVEDYWGTPVLEIAKQEGVDGYVSVGGQLPRQEALQFLAGATMLLNLPQDNDSAIPAKIYEYAQMNAWLLVLASEQSATAQLLRDSEAHVVEPTDVDAIAQVIRKRYEDFSNGVRPEAVGRDGRFDRRKQSEKLIAMINHIIAHQRSR